MHETSPQATRDTRPAGALRATALCLLSAPAVLDWGCTTYRPPDGQPSPQALDGFMSRPATATRHEATYAASSGPRLGFVAHKPADGQSDAAVVYLHGIESHAGWFDLAGAELLQRGFDVYCLDRRGSGINRQNRGRLSGHSEAFDDLLADVHFFIHPLQQHYREIWLCGLSWGGKLALAYTLAYPQDVEGLILITPGLRARVDVDGLTKLNILLSNVGWPRQPIDTPIAPEMFTTTPQHLATIEGDPLRLHRATARFFYESRRLDGFVNQHVAHNTLPVLLFLAGQDRIIDNDAVVRLLQRSSGELAIRTYEDQTHSIQFDAPQRLADDMARWIEQQRSPQDD